MRVLFDKNVPVPLRRLLPGHVVGTVEEEGRDTLANGRFLRAAEERGYDVLLTCDQNVPRQQNLAGRRLAVVVLDTNIWSVLRSDPARVAAALEGVRPGACRIERFARAPLRRRAFIPPGADESWGDGSSPFPSGPSRPR